MDVKWRFNELTNTGATGDPTKGTREKGLRMKEVLVGTIVELLAELDRTDWDYRSPEVKARLTTYLEDLRDSSGVQWI